MEKIWLDITSLRQVNLMLTLLPSLPEDTEVIVTVSKNPGLVRILEGSGVPYRQFNGTKHGDGPSGYGERILALTDFVKRGKPDLLISDLDPLRCGRPLV